MTAAIAVVLFFAIPTLAGLAICAMGKRADEREHAQAIHPANYETVDEVFIFDCPCEYCRQVVYQVVTDGHDLLVVLWKEWDAFDTAVRWHREFECERVSA